MEKKENMNMTNISKDLQDYFLIECVGQKKEETLDNWDLKRRRLRRDAGYRGDITDRNKNGNNSFSKKEFKCWMINIGVKKILTQTISDDRIKGNKSSQIPIMHQASSSFSINRARCGISF